MAVVEQTKRADAGSKRLEAFVSHFGKEGGELCPLEELTKLINLHRRTSGGLAGLIREHFQAKK